MLFTPATRASWLPRWASTRRRTTSRMPTPTATRASGSSSNRIFRPRTSSVRSATASMSRTSPAPGMRCSTIAFGTRRRPSRRCRREPSSWVAWKPRSVSRSTGSRPSSTRCGLRSKSCHSIRPAAAARARCYIDSTPSPLVFGRSRPSSTRWLIRPATPSATTSTRSTCSSGRSRRSTTRSVRRASTQRPTS